MCLFDKFIAAEQKWLYLVHSKTNSIRRMKEENVTFLQERTVFIVKLDFAEHERYRELQEVIKAQEKNVPTPECKARYMSGFCF